MKIVVKIGGFLFPDKLDTRLLQDYLKEIRSIHQKGHRMIIVTGGGAKARDYINVTRKLNGDEGFCDKIGILVSRINAYIMMRGLGDLAFPDIPYSLDEIRNFFSHGRIVLTGGLQPGQSTNTVAALAAEAIGADVLINLTDVEGVYNKDPEKFKNAHKLDEIKVNDLARLTSKMDVMAGSYKLFDPLAVKIISRSQIPTIIANGKTVANLRKIIAGKKAGTRIIFP